MNKLVLKHLLTFLLLSFPLQVCGWFVLAVYLPLHMLFKRGLFLPKYLRWFDNAEFFLVEQGLKKTYKIDFMYGPWDHTNQPWYKKAWKAYIWLGWRNSTNYFSNLVLGKIVDNTEVGVIDGSPPSLVLHEELDGWYYQSFMKDGKLLSPEYIWEFGLIKSLKWFKLRVRVGYKIGDVHTQPVFPYMAQWVFSIGTKGK